MGEVYRRFATFEPKWRDLDSDKPKDAESADEARSEDAAQDEEAKPRSLSILASTDDAVDWGGWREVLTHEEGSIDSSAARALLLNHDPNQICGKMVRAEIGEEGLDVEAELLPGAMLASGVSVEDAVDSGALRGVSIGYTYDRADTDFDEDTRTLTVRKWRLLETTLTAIPADARAQVRSLPFTPVSAPAALTKEIRMSEPVNPKPQGTETAPDLKARDESVRAAVIAETREVAEMARSLKLDAADYAGLPKAEAQSKMLRDMAEKNKTPEPKQHAVHMTVDAADKAREAITHAIAHGANFRDRETMDGIKGNPLAGRGLRYAAQKFARMTGEAGAEDWSNGDIANYILGKRELIRGYRSNGNVSSGQFPSFVFLNAITKIVDKGFEMAAESTAYGQIVSDNTVPDFKQFSIGSLGVGNLTRTPEGIPFPELDKSEGVYNSTAKMWGGTMCLTFEALVNDDTGEFNRHLRMAGALAQKTIDRRVFQKLLMGSSTSEATSTWTSNTTSGCSPVWTTADTLAAARAKVNNGIVALMNKVGKDGNPLGTQPKFFIAGPTAGAYLMGLQQTVGGQSVGNAFAGFPGLIVTPWLEASALAGNSTTTFYVLGDPNTTTGLVLTKLMGYESVQVMPFDSGATAGLNWKLWLPFEADLVAQTYTPPAVSGSAGTSTTVIAAAQQCTT